MEILTNTIILIVCFIAVGKGAIWLVDSASKLAKRMGVSELLIGLTIIAFGTSAPEFGVTISAAFRGIGDISVGNIIGSNIFNLGIILGSVAIIRNMKTSYTLVYRDGIFLLISSILAVIFLWDLEMNRIEGIILFLLLFLYLAYLYHERRPLETVKKTKEFHSKDMVLLLFGLALLLIGSHYLVSSAVKLAKIWGVSEWIIGATIIAAGTSAPEIATSIIASFRGHHGISLGNLIGSDIFNLLGVLGLAAIIYDLPIEIFARFSLLVLIFMVALVLIFLRTGWVLSRKEGIILVLLGIARWTFSFLI